MKINQDVVLYGREAALIPYAAKHVSKRAAWLQSDYNRIDRSGKAPTPAEEAANQVALVTNNELCVFMVSDVDMLSDPAISENDSLIGEAHLRVYGDKITAEMFVMLTDRSVRRKALVSETLLLLIHFGVRALGIQTFVVTLDPEADVAVDNRVLFAARPDGDVDSPAPHRKSSVGAADAAARKASGGAAPVPVAGGDKKSSGGLLSPKLKRAVTAGLQKIFRRKKTDFLNRLTRHLLREDEGEHWPPELDFELTEPSHIELAMTAEAAAKLEECVHHVKRVKYSAITVDGTLRKPSNTRVDGVRVVLVPYEKRHVDIVHNWMQMKEMCTSFGLLPPTHAQEVTAQSMMAAADDCHAFLICSKAHMDDKYPVHLEGRAQLISLGPGVVQLLIGLVTTDAALKAELQRETLLALLYYISVVLPIHTVKMVATVAIKPKMEEGKWSNRLDFEPTPDGKHVQLKMDDSGVKFALARVTKSFVVRTYFPGDVVYEADTEL